MNVMKELQFALECNKTLERERDAARADLAKAEEFAQQANDENTALVAKNISLENDNILKDGLIKLRDQRVDRLEAALKFHPRAAKMMMKEKNFVVVAEDEPYFLTVYTMIRNREISINRWSAGDEEKYRAALFAIAGPDPALAQSLNPASDERIKPDEELPSAWGMK